MARWFSNAASALKKVKDRLQEEQATEEALAAAGVMTISQKTEEIPEAHPKEQEDDGKKHVRVIDTQNIPDAAVQAVATNIQSAMNSAKASVHKRSNQIIADISALEDASGYLSSEYARAAKALESTAAVWTDLPSLSESVAAIQENLESTIAQLDDIFAMMKDARPEFLSRTADWVRFREMNKDRIEAESKGGSWGLLS
ncbi:hypothetical protein J8273_6641 [Carpediemonas membranifera]|uniref:Uncharacterized protein n=1 Tax=Carpediemonas membranifera TaxID=201153 RepID=A0A8J6E8K8_9EUKA|nr:hypothetical protein J8273_6641 [Carpediemonas membranifera]|eukprot:KAG9392050.1 hypothetical protein J8273_6641 [Carpediemonas membranifera]